MSQENVEVVRRAWGLFMEGLDPWDQGLLAPDSTLHTAGEVVGTASYVGRDGWFEFMRLWTEAFEGWAISPERFIDAGEDRVVVIVSQTATGKASGVPVDLRHGILYSLENEQITVMHMYGTPQDALDAAGLSE